jgi:hypothetical protein
MTTRILGSELMELEDAKAAAKAEEWVRQQLNSLQLNPLPPCPSTLEISKTQDGVIEGQEARALCIIYAQIIHESKNRDGSQHARRIDALEDRLGPLVAKSLIAEKQVLVQERQDLEGIALYARLYAGWKLTLEEIELHPHKALPEDTLALPCEIK